MSRRFVSVVGVAVVLFALVAGVASAQSAKKVQFETSFSFLVNDKEMPAGRYQVEALMSQGPTPLVLRNLKTNESVAVKVITRLADLAGSEPQIIFDKTQDAHFLAEVHYPGMDGFAIQGAPGVHGHEKVAAKQ
jgi:hypothetical protein